jgi:hypothetical protein
MMSDQDPIPAEEPAREDEYDELVPLIVAGRWHPGDLVRTATGTIWQFREVPYTSDFPEGHERRTACVPG